MSLHQRPGLLSRRQLLGGVATLAGAALLAACGGSSPTAVPAGGGAASAAPAASAAGGSSVPAPASAAAAAASAVPDLKVVSGKFNVWFNANWNIVTDEAVGQVFVDWGKANNIEVEWQSIPGSPVALQKASAAVAAGQPPEVTNQDNVYWYDLGEKGEVTDLVNKYKDAEGGMYPLALSSGTATDGKIYQVPYAVDCWPAHWRMDIIGEKTGGKFFESYDQLLSLGPSIQQPPRTNLFGYCLGHEGDHVNSLCTTLWSFNGRLNDEKGVPDIINPNNKTPIEYVKKMWDANLIPKDSFAQTVTSWNNENYQKGRVLATFNPATIMGWLLVNDKELGEKTALSLGVPGPSGAFAEGAAIGFGWFKKAPNAAKSLSALEYLIQPANLQKISKSVEGRFVPVYRNHAKGEFWEKSKFAQLAQIADNGRVRNWPAPPQPWLADVTDAKYVLSDMMNRIINEGQTIESAQEWAQGQMMESYEKFKKA